MSATAERTDVVAHEVAAPPTPASESASIIQMIERVAMNPAADIDKMERLLLMREREQARHAERAFNDALNQAQAEMRPIAADASNPQTKSRYASYAALDKAVRPIYTKVGLSLSFNTGDATQPDYMRVLCYVAHSEGHSRTYHADMPADGKGAKGGDVMTKTHATGAAMTYGQRYLLKMIFNIAVGEDNDGNAPVSRITDAQLGELVALMEDVGADRDRFLAYFRVDTLAHLPAKRYAEAVRALEAKRGK